jgi:hypothetical protein
MYYFRRTAYTASLKIEAEVPPEPQTTKPTQHRNPENSNFDNENSSSKGCRVKSNI